MSESGSLLDPPSIISQYIGTYQSGALCSAPKLAYAGVISPGLYQFNVVVPASAPDGDYNVIVRYSSGTMIFSNDRIAISH